MIYLIILLLSDLSYNKFVADPIGDPNVEQTYTEIAIFCLPCYDNERINNDKTNI